MLNFVKVAGAAARAQARNYDLANSGGVSGGSGGKCRFCASLSAKHGSFFFLVGIPTRMGIWGEAKTTTAS